MRRFVQAFASGGGFPATFPTAILDSLVNAPDRYNIAVRKPASVIVLENGGLVAREFQWELIPRWSKTPDTPYTTVTARLERASASRLFKQAWEARHCVVPLNGYYKWDRTVKPATPYFIQSTDGQVLLVAALWELWEKGEMPISTFSILTHANAAIPSPLVADGPVFLGSEAWSKWLEPTPWFPHHMRKDRQPALEAYPVSRAIRDASRDDYTLLEPAQTATWDDTLAADEEDEDDNEL